MKFLKTHINKGKKKFFIESAVTTCTEYSPIYIDFDPPKEKLMEKFRNWVADGAEGKNAIEILNQRLPQTIIVIENEKKIRQKRHSR
jgi:hypothetical protein